MSCCQAARTLCRSVVFTPAKSCAPCHAVKRHGYVPRAFERMTNDTTVTAPSTACGVGHMIAVASGTFLYSTRFMMKIKVVAPPDGNIFTVGAKRFHCAEVLPTEVFVFLAGLHRVANSSGRRFLSFVDGILCNLFWLFSGANMIAICSNTTVYVRVTIFALDGPVGVLIASMLPGSCQQLESDY